MRLENWISVKERMPQDASRQYLCVVQLAEGFIWKDVFYPKIEIHGVSEIKGEIYFNISSLEKVTHWAPLPDLPEELSETEQA